RHLPRRLQGIRSRTCSRFEQTPMWLIHPSTLQLSLHTDASSHSPHYSF
uniref:Uncharacterized protein n=1 Tax=Aegilops tauschii subsp. strangulata TaxID=200361 RepID=A0A453MI33_AEGTS